VENEKSVETYLDLTTKSCEKTQYFFLENILKARIALHLDTGLHDYDEEVNMYLAELLKSLVTPSAFTENRPYISPFDYEVKSFIDSHPDTRTEFTVYKENADFGLAATSVFLEYFHRGSYWHKMMQHPTSGKRISLYYKLAASALSHLRGTHTTSVHVYLSLADHMDETLRIVRKVSGDCLDFIEKMSAGSEFQLEKELADAAKVKIYKDKLDDFLKAWKEHKEDGSEEKRVKLVSLVDELKGLNPEFKFDIK
jgi:hypothetical protein